MSDLVEELRELSKRFNLSYEHDNLLSMAADEIERLQVEVARLDDLLDMKAKEM